ncbi:MAG: DUF4340 domain-containing protein [Alphaproteobacteria bacterium]|nr:DUF4340 domain-containing protein [Alphaproteobacteria bacterium]
MSEALTPFRRRGRQALIAAVLAALLLVSGAIAVWRDAAAGAPPEVSGPVVPGWAELAPGAAEIEITGRDDAFALVRTEDGWVMPSRGNYPVRPEPIAALDAALSALSFERAMTRDPEKFDRLGLADPAAGGDGVRLVVRDSQGEVLADLIAGDRSEDGAGMYVRRAGGLRAFAATGALPELADPGVWLGLNFWDIDPSAVARARIRPERGPAWFVQRAGIAQRNHELMEPDGWRLITGGAANGVATAGARLRFRDVRPAGTLTGAFAASHSGVTFSGLAYRFDFIAEGEDRWALIEVEAVADDAAERADRLTDLTEGWAFRVSEDAYERLTRPLDQVAERSGD